MVTRLPDDPRMTYAVIKLQDVLEEQDLDPDPDYTDIVSHRDEVLKRYQAIFNPERIRLLSKKEFEDFLLYKNNHHWSDLHRVRKHMTADMVLLRDAITLLLDETIPVRERLNQIRPERYWGEHSMVSHLGMPVLTAILMVAFPDNYGVWNNTSDEGLKIVKLWDPRWEHEVAGDSYVEMNSIYLQLCQYLEVDLWSLDALWWVIKKKRS